MALARTHTPRTERKADDTREPMLTGLFATPGDTAEDREPEDTTEEDGE